VLIEDPDAWEQEMVETFSTFGVPAELMRLWCEKMRAAKTQEQACFIARIKRIDHDTVELGPTVMPDGSEDSMHGARVRVAGRVPEHVSFGIVEQERGAWNVLLVEQEDDSEH
jgi:hypothetical protein